jgi:hypothetical protein
MEAAPVPVIFMDAVAEDAVDLAPAAPAVDLAGDRAPSGDICPPALCFSQPLEDMMAAAAEDMMAAAAADAPRLPPLASAALREELAQLREEAAATSATAASAVEIAAQTEIDAVVCRLRAEQDRLYSLIIDHVPVAVRGAASLGARSAVVLHFAGQDKLDEFCYLYMLKGPATTEGKATLRRLGIVPVLARLRETLNPVGFRVWHTWQRATNDNTLAVSW